MSASYSQRLAELAFYPLWSSLPAARGAVDPFDYKQRLAVYKLLVECTNERGLFGNENELNLFWGYAFQLDWQWRSGRLQLAHTPPERIDPNSMWGYGNYTLSVLPLIAAINIGIIPAIEILPPYTTSEVEYARGVAGVYRIPAALLEPLRAWEAFFKLLQGTEPGTDLEPLRFELWKAHHHSLLAAEGGSHQLGARYYAPLEVAFRSAWTRTVDFFGLAAWRTDLLFMLENGLGELPERVLTAQDVPGQIPDMDARVNRNIHNSVALARQSKLRFGFNLWLWKRAMRTRPAREEVLPMLNATFNPSPANAADRRKLFRYIVAL